MADKNKGAKEKPLEKMTAKELREIAMNIPEMKGVHGMNKTELISGIQAARGIEAPKNSKKADSTVREIKKKLKQVRGALEKAVGAEDQKMTEIYKRRARRLKKRTRRAA